MLINMTNLIVLLQRKQLFVSKSLIGLLLSDFDPY